MNDSVADFSLGDTIPGTNDSGASINDALEGRTYEFPVTKEVANSLGLVKRTIGMRITARIYRNTSGSVLLPGTLGKVAATAGIAGLARTTAVTSADDRLCHIVDPSIPAAGVKDDDLYFGIVGGPSSVLLPAAGEAVTAGDILVAGASGRATKATIAAESHLVIGTVLQTAAQAATVGKLMPILVHPAWE